MAEAKRVAIIDYRMGNLFSVEHACAAVGIQPVITSDTDAILACDGAILPGVGAFGEAMENMRRLGLDGAVKRFLDTGRPFMGVCLGLQLLFEESEEFGSHRGLGLIRGSVRRFPGHSSSGETIRVPQIGWNQIRPAHGRAGDWDPSPLRGIAEGEYMYFVHSYYVAPAESADALSMTRYEGLEYCSSVRRENLFASQFHPEKSAREGLRVYRNWADTIIQRG
jgi:glutamine amidotransferase